MSEALPEGTLSVVFTDVEGSTRLLRALVDRFDGLMSRHQALVREAMAAHRGVEVRTEGDAFLVVFLRPGDALQACVAAQRLLAAEPWPDDGVFRVRMGIHVGEVRRGGGNYSGLGLYQGSRVAPAAHGGQVIVSAALAAAVGHALPEGVSLLDLGAFHLRDFDAPQHLFQVLHPDLEANFPPPRVASAVVHNLVPARTSFVGRSREFSDLLRATDTGQLVTIVGPGGVGKTRLATEVGLGVAGRYPEGVWLVPLASIDSSDAVAEQAKTAMGLVDQPGKGAAEVIANRLALGPGLIILDNCEHVLDGCVALVESLLAASHNTRVLATSRENLGVSGEEVVRLGPMELPGTSDVGASAAVELFVARGGQARRGFELTEENSQVIASVCRRLDGIPLALELAAARLSGMSVDQLHRRLDDAISLLGSGRRGGEERQRTLRATLEWSHRLLSLEDQAVFRRLSIFRGDFSLDAAEEILGGNGVDQNLENLVVHSLLEFDPNAESPRYRLLETIRAYADEYLRDSTEPPALADRHASYYARLAHDCAEKGETAEILNRLAADHPNLLAALEHLAGSNRAVDHGQLLVDLAPFWSVRGHWRLARQEYLVYLARADRDRALEGRVVGHLGGIALKLGDYPGARARTEEALAIARELGDRSAEGKLAGSLGTIAYYLGNYPQARAHYEEALAVARELGDRRGEVQWVANLGNVADALGDYAGARARLEEALAVARELGDRRAEVHSVGGLGGIAQRMGDYPEARARYMEALAINRELGDRHPEGFWVARLGLLAQELGDHAEARARFKEALAISRELGDRSGEGKWVGSLGLAAAAAGSHPDAQAHYREALAIARELGDRRGEVQWVGNLGCAAFELGDYTEARARLEEARAIARELGYREAERFQVNYLGMIATELGDHPAARFRFEEALGIARDLGTPDTDLLESCASLLARVDQCENAAELLGATNHLNIRSRKVRDVSDQARFDATVDSCRGRLGEEAYDVAFKRGGGLDWPSAVEAALGFIGRVSRQPAEGPRR